MCGGAREGRGYLDLAPTLRVRCPGFVDSEENILMRFVYARFASLRKYPHC
jgi:hypothetical protein